MPPKERHKLQPRNFEARPPGPPSSGLHMGNGGGQRPAVSYSSERGGPSDEYLKNPMGGGHEPLRGYYGWENVTPRDVRYDPQLPVEYQYPSGGRTRVSDVEPDWTDFGSPYRNTRTSDWYEQNTSPMTPEWQWPEGYWPQNYQAGITNTNKGSNILNDYLNYSDSNFDFDFGKQKVSWNPELFGGNFNSSISPEGLYLGMKWVR